MSYLGIFWYDEEREELCGVFKAPENEINENYNGDQVFPSLHRDVWQDMQNKYYNQYREYVPDDLYPTEDENPFAEPDYTLVPRGRVTGTPTDYRVYHGDWIYDDYAYIKQLILDEFDLDEDETVFQHDVHWDLGHGWSE